MKIVFICFLWYKIRAYLGKNHTYTDTSFGVLKPVSLVDTWGIWRFNPNSYYKVLLKWQKQQCAKC